MLKTEIISKERTVQHKDPSNPNLQCQRCGKWRRLYDAQGNQLSYPYYHPDLQQETGNMYELYGQVCNPCIDELEDRDFTALDDIRMEQVRLDYEKETSKS